MSAIFFRELKIKKPKYNLKIGSGSQGEQTARMLIGIEKILLKEKPNLVLIYGDTNSTLAGALAAAKLHIPVAHVEAGMRSYNIEMPEELNRIISDHISSILLCPTKSSVEILNGEGIRKDVYFVGDVMMDILISQKSRKNHLSKIFNKLKIKPKDYILLTVHRQENTDNKKNLKNIIEAIAKIEDKIIWPLHPRTNLALKKYKLEKHLNKYSHIHLIEPIGYLEMLELETNAKVIITDSGGVQKESYIARIPCITLRNETEWLETVKSGWNVLAGSDIVKIRKSLNKIYNTKWSTKQHPDFLGDGKAAKKIGLILKRYLINGTNK